MIVKAVSKKVGISARKGRIVADVVKGMKASEALDMLKYVNKGSAIHVLKTIKSAVANAKHNYGLSESSLIVKDVRLDRGMQSRRIYYTGKGGARFLLKPSSHITVELEDKSAAAEKELKADVKSVSKEEKTIKTKENGGSKATKTEKKSASKKNSSEVKKKSLKPKAKAGQ